MRSLMLVFYRAARLIICHPSLTFAPGVSESNIWPLAFRYMRARPNKARTFCSAATWLFYISITIQIVCSLMRGFTHRIVIPVVSDGNELRKDVS